MARKRKQSGMVRWVREIDGKTDKMLVQNAEIAQIKVGEKLF